MAPVSKHSPPSLTFPNIMAPQKTLRESALQTNKSNPSQLGDPVSLKAETSKTSPTDQDRGAGSPSSLKDIKNITPAPTEGDADKKGKGKSEGTLRQKALQKLQENPSQLGDPVSLKAETADSQPTENDRGAGKPKL